MHSVDGVTNKNFAVPYLEVQGGSSLSGSVRISGAKNSALVLMAASLLTKDSVTINNIPQLTDIEMMSSLLKAAGVSIKRQSNQIKLSAQHIRTTELPFDLVHSLRASFVCIGPLLARQGIAIIPLPGGCQIGSRPVDQHIKGLKALGADVIIKDDTVIAKLSESTSQLKGSHIKLNCKSVGATETLLMAATLAKGETIIENAAQEPEIQDLAEMLNKMGAHITGAGTSIIKIQGKTKLQGAIHTVIPDRIEAGTFLIAAAITKSKITISPVNSFHLQALIRKLEECGCLIKELGDSIEIVPSDLIKSVDITTSPFPGFPTDLQAPFMALMTTSKGTSKITEKIFENRMQHVNELNKLGAKINIEGDTAIVKGTYKLNSSNLSAGDLRSSAAMVLACISANGTSIIKGLEHLDRGYENLEEKLNQIGCNIVRKQANFSLKINVDQKVESIDNNKQQVA